MKGGTKPLGTRRAIEVADSSRPGGGRDGFADRLAYFEQAYMSNGNNSTAAAITAGYAKRTAYAKGHSLLKKLRESGRLAEVAQKAAQVAELSTERTLREVRDVAYNDPRRFFRENGTLKPPSEWDDAMAACVQSLEVGEVRSGKDGKVVTWTSKIKFWNKLDAIDKAMKHLGLFERDNAQSRESLVLHVEAARPVKR